MRGQRALSAVGIAVASALAGQISAAAQAASPPPAPVQPAATRAAAPSAAPSAERALVQRYCVTCHNERRNLPAGSPLLLDKLDVDHVAAQPAIWEKVVRKVRSGAMPPAGMPRPDAPALTAWVTTLERSLERAAAESPNPGRPAPVHRLNRTEYTNAVRDLIGLEVDGRALLPPDDAGYGFDNIGDVLSVSPGLMERYMLAAAKISRQALGDVTLRPTTVTYKTSALLLQNDRMSEDLPFGSRGGLAVRHNFPLDGEYVLKVDISRNLDGAPIRGNHDMEVRIDRARVKVLQVGATSQRGSGKALIEVPIVAKAGERLVSVSFVGELDQTLPRDGRPAAPPPTAFAYQLFPIDAAVNNMQIVGPYNGQVPEDTASRRRIFVCEPATRQQERICARQILSSLARRAYRRPVAEGDVAPLLAMYDAGRKSGDFEAGIRWGLEAMLVSPKFLFRVERDPATAAAGKPYQLSDIELASRLSFFLWSSIPDDELIGLAARGTLHQPAVIEAQVKRMLADSRSKALMSNFAGQWLWLRNIRMHSPNADLFPNFDDNLREAFQQETELFLYDQLVRDRGVVELLTANYTFLNQRLAEHYGVPDVYGSHFRRVTFSDDRRAGLLGQGSILTITSEPNRTSVVKRGKWLLENILGAPPPPPPPNVPALKENGEGGKAATVRERMEQHRKNPVCASCHAQIDPLGFAFENFDAVGRWRTEDQEAHTAIDASGKLVDGSAFNGPSDLRALLLKRRVEFVNTVLEKLMTYALGRGLEYYDAPVVRQILRSAEPSDYRWSALIQGIVKSAPFQKRRAADRTDDPAGAGKTIANLATPATRRSQ